jgi:hypothetical protein
VEVRAAYWKSSLKLDLKVEMCTLCSIFVEIESTNDKYKYEYRCNVMCHAIVVVVRRRVVSLMRFSAQSLWSLFSHSRWGRGGMTGELV